jgi:hypothetical protein
MAFAIRNLSVLAYANGFTLWHYKAGSDDQRRVANPGFFSEAGDMLTAGDMVMVSAVDGGRLVCLLPDGNGMRAAPLG